MEKRKKILCITTAVLVTFCSMIMVFFNTKYTNSDVFNSRKYIMLMHNNGLDSALNTVQLDLSKATTDVEKQGLLQMLRVLPMLEEK